MRMIRIITISLSSGQGRSHAASFESMPRRLVPAQVDLTGLATGLPTDLLPRSADKPARQRGGRDAAEALLATFLSDRACDWRTGMSSPLTADSACSRLSVHFASGSLSIREATSRRTAGASRVATAATVPRLR